jgi:hypothetical protein
MSKDHKVKDASADMTERRLLPNHWVGVMPKRQLPQLSHSVAQARLCGSCHGCSNRAVDDKSIITTAGVDYSDIVYCSMHGWQFESIEQERMYTCFDFHEA